MTKSRREQSTKRSVRQGIRESDREKFAETFVSLCRQSLGYPQIAKRQIAERLTPRLRFDMCA
jgi:hypothetical protein